MSRKDNQLVNSFLSDFIAQLTDRYANDIDFILLFGSVARGEFKAGVSDIDLIIQLKDSKKTKEIEKHAELLFWKLDKKHGTQFEKVCSTSKETGLFGKIEKQVKLYKPFEILGPKDIDWENGKISSLGMGSWAAIAPVTQFAKKIKAEGKIIYGRNVLKEMKIPYSFLDKIKGFFIPIAISLVSFPISLFLPDKGIKYATKAILYSVDDQLFILDKEYKGKLLLNMKILRAELGENYSVRLLKEAIQVKKEFEKTKKEWTYFDKIAFCWQSFWYILFNNIMSVFRSIGKVISS